MSSEAKPAEVSTEAIDSFFRWIYDGIQFDGTTNRIVVSDRKFQKNAWCMNVETAVRLSASYAAKKQDTYYRVAVCEALKKPDMRSRGTAADAKIVTALCFDFDACASGEKNGKRIPRNVDEILGCIESVQENLRPNKIICSGVGVHGYWKLRTPHIIEDRERTSDILKGFDRWLAGQFKEKHGFEFDCVNELARVLRVPGTIHCKKEPRPVYEIESDLIRDEPYDIGEFDFAATIYEQSRKSKASVSITTLPLFESESKTQRLLHDAAVLRMLGCKASDAAREKTEKDGSNRVVTYARIAIGTGLDANAAAVAVADALKQLPTPIGQDIASRVSSVIERGETKQGVDLFGLSVDEAIRHDRIEAFFAEASEIDTEQAEKRLFAMACLAVEFEMSIHEWIAGLRKIEAEYPLYDFPFVEGREPLIVSDAELVAILISAVGNESVGKVDPKIVKHLPLSRILSRLRFGMVERSEGAAKKYAAVAAETIFSRLGMRGDGEAIGLLAPIVRQFCQSCRPVIDSPDDVVREAVNHGVAKMATLKKPPKVRNEDRDAVFAAAVAAGGDASRAIAEIEADGGDYVPVTSIGVVQGESQTMEETRRIAESTADKAGMASTLKIVSEDLLTTSATHAGDDSGKYDEVDGIIRISPRDACYAVVKSVMPELHIWIPGAPTKLSSVPLSSLYSSSGWIAFNNAWIRLTGQFLPARYRGKSFDMFLSNVVERKCAILSAREEDPVVFAHALISQAIAWARGVAETIDEATKRKLPVRRDIVDKHFADRGLAFNRGLRISDDEDFDRTSLDSKPRGFAMDRTLGIVAHSPTLSSVIKANDFQISSGIRSLIINELESFGFEKANSLSMRFWLLTFQKYRSLKIADTIH